MILYYKKRIITRIVIKHFESDYITLPLQWISFITLLYARQMNSPPLSNLEITTNHYFKDEQHDTEKHC